MSLADKQIAFAIACLDRLQNGHPDLEPVAADFKIDYFAAMAISLLVHRLFEESALAAARRHTPNSPCLLVSPMRRSLPLPTQSVRGHKLVLERQIVGSTPTHPFCGVYGHGAQS